MTVLEDILQRYESKTVNGARGTVYGALQAVTESADWGKLGGKYQGDEDKRNSRRLVNIIGGTADDVKTVATNYAASLTA